MFLLEVIPFARLPKTLPESFSYFSALPLPQGAIVSVEINRRELLGLVLKSVSVKDAKQTIRQASFSLKRVRNVIAEEPMFNNRDLTLLRWLSDHYLAHPALFLRMLAPPFLFSAKSVKDWPRREHIKRADDLTTKTLISPNPADRYLQLIRRALEENRQALIIVPEIARGEFLFETLAKSLPTDKILFLSSDSGLKNFRAAWHRAREETALAVIATRIGLFLPFGPLKLIIIDDDGSPAHKSWDQEPRYHTREVASMLHELHGGRLVFSGYPPSLDAYERTRYEDPTAEKITDSANEPQRLLFVDMQKEIKEAGKFVSLSEPLQDKLRTTVLESGSAFLFVNRRGFAPFILCQQCGKAFLCDKCSVPLVYHVQESFSEATLLCHHCGAKLKAPDTCATCGSHLLKAYGIGVERVAKEIKALFPAVPVLLLAADSPGAREKATVMKKLRSLGSFIAVGTEYALSLNLPKVTLAAVVSIDTALNLPDYMQNERLFRILLLTRELARKAFIVQSFSKEPELLQDLFHGTFSQFAEKELKERRRFHYPPFGELIKLTVRDQNRENALQDVKRLFTLIDVAKRGLPKDALEISNPYPAYIEKKRGFYIFHILIKIIERSAAREAKAILRETIPPNVLTDIGPDSLL